MNAMPTATAKTPLSEADIVEAKRIWEQYQREHDLTGKQGYAAGIDPKTGEVWIDEDIVDLILLRKSQGLTSPLFFERVGAETFYTKGWRA